MSDWVVHDLSAFVDGYDGFGFSASSTAAYSGGTLHMVTIQPVSGIWSVAFPGMVLPHTGEVAFEVTQTSTGSERAWAAYGSKAVPPGIDDYGIVVANGASTASTVTTDFFDTSLISDAFPYLAWEFGPLAQITQIRTMGLVDVEPPEETLGLLKVLVDRDGVTEAARWQTWGFPNETAGVGKVLVGDDWHQADDDAATVTGQLKILDGAGVWQHVSWMTGD